MATSTQTDELGRNLSDNDLAALMSEMYPISLSHILEFGIQLHISSSKIEELSMRLYIPNKKGEILREILQEALRREPPLTRREIIQALQNRSVGESHLASQIVSQYQRPSQRDRETPQHSCLQQPPSAPLRPTLGNVPQIFSSIQPPPWPNTSQLLFPQRLTTEVARTNQSQSNPVGQSHQLPASIPMPPQPAPQTNQSVSLQSQPGPSLPSLQWTPQMPTVPQLTPSAPPQTNVLPSSSNTQTSQWLENSQLAASQQLATQLPRPNQLQPNLDQVGQSHQLPASQRMSMPPQPGLQMQPLPQLQFPPHHPNYQHLPFLIRPGYPFSLPNPPIHRPHESQSFPPNAPSYNQYSSLRPFHSHYSSVAQPPHDQYLQPFDNQSFIQLSQDHNIFQLSRHTPYQQDQGHQSHQFQWQSSSQPPRQHHHSPVFPSQHFHTSDTNLPQTQESQSSPAPTFAATSESTPFLVPSPSPRQKPSSSPRQQPSPLPRQQPSPLPRQQPSPSLRQQPISASNSGSPALPPAKRLRQQSPSPSCHSSPASESTVSTAGYPPHVHDFISFVKTTYSAQRVLRDEKWSLSPTVKFINLACIDRKCVKSREYNDVTKAMVMDGNVDAIQETKGPIKFTEIAKGISLPSSGSEQENDRRLILVEGAPGVGKSTFAWEFCRKWMNGEIVKQYHLVLLLRLRDKRIREAKNLKDLFFNPSRPDESLAVYNELKNSQKFHALIILEGYDELPDSCRNDPSSVFNELISGKLLPLATVLVTSRPWATKDLHVKYACHIYQHIEVLGFTKKQIKEYINKNISEEKIRSGLNSYLEKHPQIRSGMYIPLNSAIVVAVYKDNIENDRQTLPNTITELYSCCIEILIRRHLKRNIGLQGGNEMNLPAINLCVPSDVHRNFVHMCHLAFSGIVEATEVKLIFSESELPEHFDNLGFMDSVTDLYVTGKTVSSHNFLHLTFQEFFAAVHISTMCKEQQLQYFMKGKSDSGSKGGRLNVVLKFLAGLRKLDCVTKETASHIIVITYVSTPRVGTNVVNWLFEAQNETAMSLILGERKVEFKASKRHMSPMDYYSLGYCISHSQCQWVLRLESKMELTKERIKMLADGAREVTGVGKVVELGDEVLSHLNEDKLSLLYTEWKNILCIQRLIVKETPSTVLPDLSQLEVLSVSFGNKATEQDIVTIANHLPFATCLKNFTLKTYLDIGHITAALATGQLQQLGRLDLEIHSITDNRIEFLITFLRNSSSLQHLSIGSLTSSAHKLLELLQTVDHHPTLQEKSIKGLGCRLTIDVDVNALSQLCSEYCDSMKTDFIQYVGGLSDDGVGVLAEILQHKCGSRELDLSGGETSDDGTVSLAKALHHNSTIHELKLHYNNISDKGAVVLANALHHNSTLQSLNLGGNSIGDEGAVALADALHHNSTLQSLTLYYNSIGKEGAVALADALHHNSTLQSLNLGGNSIGDEGAVALADALHHNSTLQSLILSANSIGDEGAVALADALHHNSTLQLLSLNYNSIGDEGAVALVEALLENQSLQSLYVYGNDGIGDRATGEFVEALTQNSSINKVGLPGRCKEYATKCPNYHQIQTKLSFNEGAVALADALQHNSTLQSLDLSNKGIDVEKAVALADSLQHNSTLQSLDLRNNSIGDKGTVVLADALHYNSVLQSLYLSNNSIGDEGAVALAEALHQNSIFQSLNLDNNSISSVGATAIAQSLYYNSTLKQLSLGGNIIGNSGAVALAESLHQNTTLQVLSLSGNHISCDILTTSSQSLPRLPVPDHVTIISILRVTNKGIRFEDTFNDFILDIPDGAIPEEEVTLTLYMGVTLFGPYQFPEGLRPISPVFWVCVKEQNNFQFSKPVTVTIPHCLDLDNYDNIQSLGLTFLKAGHIMNTEKMYEFQCTNSGKDLSKTHGIFTTSHFCSLCMAANDIPQIRNGTSFCLTVAIPKFTIPVGKSVYAYFFITFMRLKTCLEAVNTLIEKMGLKLFRIQREQFEFEKNRNPALEIACTDSEHGKIRVTGKTTVCCQTVLIIIIIKMYYIILPRYAVMKWTSLSKKGYQTEN